MQHAEGQSTERQRTDILGAEMQRRPTLLNSCAQAATAAEARFRIDPEDLPPRVSRIIALDEQSASIVGRVALLHWSGGHFLVFDALLPVDGRQDEPVDAVLRTSDGEDVRLTDELDGADVVVMVATSQAHAEAASIIGDACALRLITTVGLVVPDSVEVDETVTALRPNAMVLLVLEEENDISAILSALRV